MTRKFRHRSWLGALALPMLGLLIAPQLGCGQSKQESENTGVGKIVYAVRQHTVDDGENVDINVAGGMGQVMDYKRYLAPGSSYSISTLGRSRTSSPTKKPPTLPA